MGVIETLEGILTEEPWADIATGSRLSEFFPALARMTFDNGTDNRIANPKLKTASSSLLPSDQESEAELNFLELNGLFFEAKSNNATREVRDKLEEWAEYYSQPDHRGEIYDIMKDVVLPFLREQEDLKTAISDIRMGARYSSRSEYIENGGDIVIEGTVLRMYQGTGAGSHAPHEPERTRETIRVLAYDGHSALLTSGRTWQQRQGTADTVDWFGIEDLILWPKLIFSLVRVGARVLPKVAGATRRATVRGAKAMLALTRPLTKRQVVQETKNLAKLAKELAELARVTVRLGAIEGSEFARISGLEALNNLFSRTISEIPRLAQHWPKSMAKQFVTEIQTLVMKRLKRTKIAQEIAIDFQSKTLSPELLGKLPEKLQRDIKAIVEKRWNNIRRAFWSNVFDDKALVAELKNLGIKFRKRGTIPVLWMGGKKLPITLDHVARKVENPLEAFSPDNLRAMSALENSKAKENLVRNIKQVTGLNLDEFAALGKEAERLPKALAEAFGQALDAFPSEEDLFRGWFLDDLGPATAPATNVRP